MTLKYVHALVLTFITPSVAWACASPQSAQTQSTIHKKVQHFLDQGQRQLLQEHYKAAIVSANRVLRYDPRSAEAYDLRGSARWNLEDKKGALTDYTQAIKLNAKYIDAIKNRGDLRFYALGDKQGAIQDYSRWIELDPDCIVARWTRGSAYAELEERSKAISDLQKVLHRMQKEHAPTESYELLEEQIKTLKSGLP
jgi:tetratricopeptide (TPR) repeat protein